MGSVIQLNLALLAGVVAGVSSSLVVNSRQSTASGELAVRRLTIVDANNIPRIVIGDDALYGYPGVVVSDDAGDKLIMLGVMGDGRAQQGAARKELGTVFELGAHNRPNMINMTVDDETSALVISADDECDIVRAEATKGAVSLEAL